MEKYIQVTLKHFPVRSWQTQSIQFASFEKYLEKHHRVYDCNDSEKVFTVEVQDKRDAVRLAEGAGLIDYLYFEGDKGKEMSTKPLKRSYGKIAVTVTIDGESFEMTEREYKEYVGWQVRSTHMQKSEILEEGLMSRSELEKLIAAEGSSVIRLGKRIFVDKMLVTNDFVTTKICFKCKRCALEFAIYTNTPNIWSDVSPHCPECGFINKYAVPLAVHRAKETVSEIIQTKGIM